MSRPPARALVLEFGGVVTRTLFETHPLTGQALRLAPGAPAYFGLTQTA